MNSGRCIRIIAESQGSDRLGLGIGSKNSKGTPAVAD